MDFEDIYNRYFKDVYAFVISLSHSADLSEEITQETFCKALQAYPTFRGDCEVRVWLCQIAKNIFYSLMRKNKVWDQNVDIESFVDSKNFEDSLMNQLSALEIYKILHKIEEPYKEIFLLRLFGELSFCQIGEVFEKTEVWARVTYYRAKSKVQKEWEEEE